MALEQQTLFEYSMGGTHTLDFFAYLSGRYATRKEVYSGPNGPVNLEVYYDPAHATTSMTCSRAPKAGLDYFQKNFSPYSVSAVSDPRVSPISPFAQSFPNTVPYSEGIGFIARLDKPKDIDLTYFVTAHELGHQWWGHQLIGAAVEGSNMMSETLASIRRSW